MNELRASGGPRFTIAQRTIILVTLFVLPFLALAVHFVVSGLNKDIRFARQELRGNHYQRSLEQVLEAVIRHQFATSEAFSGASGNVEPAAKAASEAFAAWGKAQEELGEALEFTDEGLARRQRQQSAWKLVAARWEQLAGGWRGLGREQSQEAHRKIIADLRAAITHAGDTSGLILDPDLDSYYLMDVTLVALPQTQDRISVLISMLRSLPPGPLSTANQIQLSAQRALLKEADADRIAADVQTSLNEDAGFYGASPSLRPKLAPAAKKYADAIDTLLAAIDGRLAGTAASSGAAIAAAENALSAAFEMWPTAAAELDKLLETRAAEFEGQRARGLGMALFALIGCSLIAVWVIRGISRGLREISVGVKSAASQIQQAAKELASTSESLARNTAQQAAEMDQTSLAISGVVDLAKSNASAAEDSAGSVTHMNENVAQADSQLNTFAQTMSRISQAAEQTTQIAKVIDQISFQTNLLALNASIEAARAGEAGQGFSVVANEVRSLAGRTTEAAQNANRLLSTCMEEVRSGEAFLAQVRDSIQTLSAQSAELRTAMQSVEQASQRQLDQAAKIDNATRAATAAVSVSAAAAEESAAAAEQLNAQVGSMNELSEQLIAMV